MALASFYSIHSRRVFVMHGTAAKSILERFVASAPTPRTGTGAGAGASDSEDQDSRSGLGDDTAVSMETAGTDGCHATGLLKWLASSRGMASEALPSDGAAVSVPGRGPRDDARLHVIG
jgi:hypothetical protein